MNNFGVHRLVWSATWDAAECERAITAFSTDLAVQPCRSTGERLASARDTAS